MNEENTGHALEDAKTVVADKLGEFKSKIEALISGNRFHEVKNNIKDIIEHTQQNFHHLDKEVKVSLKKTSTFLAQQKKELEQFQNKLNHILKPKGAKKVAAKKASSKPATKAKKKIVKKVSKVTSKAKKK